MIQRTLLADCSNLGLRSSPYFWPNVTRINISLNKLTQFHQDTSPPRILTHLDLSYNAIKHILNNTIMGLLRIFDRLNGNKITLTLYILDRNIFVDLIKMKHLDLSENYEFRFWTMSSLNTRLEKLFNWDSSLELIPLYI